MLLPRVLLLCLFGAARPECTEEDWCSTNLQPVDGKEHPNCGSWVDSCPCTCAEAANAPQPENPAVNLFGEQISDDLAKTCTADSKRKGDTIYLLYDVYYGERFNFRKSIFRRVGFTYEMLRKHTDFRWVLVLPPFRDQHGGEVEYPAWREFFEIDRLKQFYPDVIEYDQYMKDVAHHQIDVVIRKESEDSCGEGFVKYGVSPGAKPNTYELMGQIVSVKEFRCNPGAPDLKGINAISPGLLNMVADAVEDGADSVMIDDFREISPPYLYNKGAYWRWRQHLVFTKELHEEADRFLASWETLGEYVSLHLRRGDFVRAHEKTQAKTEDIIQMLHDLAVKQAVSQIFIATDQTNSELDTIQASLKKNGIGLHRYKPGYYGRPIIDYNSGTGQAKLALVEQILASRGKFFIGTKTSHFSKEIHLERRLLQGGGEEFYENSFCMVAGAELMPLCRTWNDQVECEILPLD